MNTSIQHFSDPYNIQIHLVCPQFSIVLILSDPLRSKLINVKKSFCVYWRLFRRSIQLRLLLNVFLYVFSTLSWSFLSKANLPSCHHIDRVRQQQKPTESKIFEAGSIYAEIFKVSGRNFHYESIVLEDPWWQEWFQKFCNFKEKNIGQIFLSMFVSKNTSNFNVD